MTTKQIPAEPAFGLPVEYMSYGSASLVGEPSRTTPTKAHYSHVKVIEKK
ncbi:MAG: hypothetical protein Q7T42_00205 [Methylotenera sp.]|nr:hypothetical protein [Methylotenera sp.]MDO9204612.1 hypothetical protein [Methylotenera sp.]MDO9392386.1 hypothetical protein [Methylotenera sp.]MDP1524064.1 hypothetical protein [Methylotenera sp.]MDP2231557.1 hypothetical protein [Methylotenera sp.]MDP3141760.1 hypothetical protein [Methylotenera sp.]